MSNKEKVNHVYDVVDYRMRQYVEALESNSELGTSQITIRVPNDLKARLDVLTEFLNMTRNAVIIDLLSASVESAIERMENHPYITTWEIDGKSVRQKVEIEDAALRDVVASERL